jgi:predicted kinase
MPSLFLLNGPPGAGKSTLATALAAERPLALALDVDALKHALGRWDEDPSVSGLQARRLALAVLQQHLADGYDVVMGQYLARTAFIEQLEQSADAQGARFVEVILEVPADVLADRLRGRADAPTRPEHRVNRKLVRPKDAQDLVDSLAEVRRVRTDAITVEVSGDLEATLAQLRPMLPQR